MTLRQSHDGLAIFYPDLVTTTLNLGPEEHVPNAHESNPVADYTVDELTVGASIATLSLCTSDPKYCDLCVALRCSQHPTG